MAAPAWTDNVSVVAAATLAKGATTRGTLDLRTKFGAYLFAKIGRGGTTAIGTVIGVQIRRVLNNGTQAVGIIHPLGQPVLPSSLAAANSTTVNADSNSGQAALNVASITGMAADQLICIQDSGGGVTRLEWNRISKTAAGILTLDEPLVYTHTSAQADTVRNQADVFSPIWMDGGSLWEVVFDYGAAATGDTATVQALAQTLDTIA